MLWIEIALILFHRRNLFPVTLCDLLHCTGVIKLDPKNDDFFDFVGVGHNYDFPE